MRMPYEKSISARTMEVEKRAAVIDDIFRRKGIKVGQLSTTLAGIEKITGEFMPESVLDAITLMHCKGRLDVDDLRQIAEYLPIIIPVLKSNLIDLRAGLLREESAISVEGRLEIYFSEVLSNLKSTFQE